MSEIDTIGHWSNTSMVFFIILGIYSVWTIGKIKEQESKNIHKPLNYPLISYVVIMALFAAFRLVNNKVGGTDASAYIHMFEHANTAYYQNDEWFLHNDVLFRYIVKGLRYLFTEYRIYFFLIYAFNTLSWILFLKTFCLKESNYIPCILVVFLYWISFNTLRSSFAYSVFLLSLILLYRKKYTWAILTAVSSILIHKMAALYIMFLPFYFIFTHIRLTRLRIVALATSAVITSQLIQLYFVSFTSNVDLGGAYHYYASSQIGTSFWANDWKIAFGQLLLGIAMWLYYKKTRLYRLTLSTHDRSKLAFIWTLCIFDLLCIPLNSALGIWRGYEFFYLARIIMWCNLLHMFILSTPKYYHLSIKIITTTVVILWIVFRFYNMWQDANLMPYIFEPFI